MKIDDRAEQLLALLAEQNPALALGKTASDAVHELQMFSEFKKEIACGCPMSIVWKPHQEIPAKFLRKTQQVMG